MGTPKLTAGGPNREVGDKMKQDLLDILCCPECRGELKLKSGDFHDGELLCATCSIIYPIRKDIPRVLPISYDKYTKESFTREWSELDENDKAWTLEVEQRKTDFLSFMGLSTNDVKGKILLDVGCGDGTLSSALADYGIEVIGLDITDGMERTKSRWADKAVFVQGDATKPPFKDHSFDLIWAGGSIHHTPNTARTFSTLVPLLRPGGRFGVWLYGRSFRPGLLAESLRFFIKRLSSKQQDILINLFAILLMAKHKVQFLLKMREGKVRTVGETKHRLRDALTVNYAHHHSCEEVKDWFMRAGLIDVVSSDPWGAVVCYGDMESTK
jgi:SAM-dependent methyltransferase